MALFFLCQSELASILWFLATGFWPAAKCEQQAAKIDETIAVATFVILLRDMKRDGYQLIFS